FYSCVDVGCGRCVRPTELTVRRFAGTVVTPTRDQIALRVELCHQSVTTVGDVHIPFPPRRIVDRDERRGLELPGSITGRALEARGGADLKFAGASGHAPTPRAYEDPGGGELVNAT